MPALRYTKIYTGMALTVLGILAVSGIICPIIRTGAHAEMNGIQSYQNHSGSMHEQPLSPRDIVVELKTTPAQLQAGRPATLLFSVKDREGKPIKNLAIHHDRIMHVVIASQDFSQFAHIHPEKSGPVTSRMKTSAQFPVQYKFPRAGSYMIGVDFAVGEQLFSKHFLVEVSGSPHHGTLKKDFAKVKWFGGYEVTLTSVPETIRAGQKAALRYTFRQKNKPVTDLVPYLSAPMHVAIISSDLKYFMHEHGEVHGIAHRHANSVKHTEAPDKFGPEITVHTIFPARGLYQIFAQAKHHGKVILTSFMVKVE